MPKSNSVILISEHTIPNSDLRLGKCKIQCCGKIWVEWKKTKLSGLLWQPRATTGNNCVLDRRTVSYITRTWNISSMLLFLRWPWNLRPTKTMQSIKAVSIKPAHKESPRFFGQDSVNSLIRVAQRAENIIWWMNRSPAVKMYSS